MSIRRNTTYNLLGSIVPLAIPLVTIPIYLGLIGPERYGTLAILWALMGYFGFMDIGLGRAIAQRLASATGRSPYQRSGLVWTALGMTMLLGALTGATLWLSADFILSSWIKMSPENLAEAKGAVPWFVVMMPLILSGSILSGALHGRQRFLAMNLLQIIGTTLAQLLPLTVALLGHVGLDWLVPAALSARLITFVINFHYCRKNLPLRSRPHFHYEHIRPLLSFGGWVSVSGFLVPILTAIDRMVIGVMAGMAAVTHYTIPFDLGSRLTMFSSSYASAIFPKMVNEKPDNRMVLLTERLKFLSILIAPMFVATGYVVHWFFTVWIDSAFSNQASPIALILIIGFFFNSLAILFYNYVQALGRPDYIAKSQLIQLPIYLGLLYLLLSQFGAIGAAMATALRMIMGFSFLLLFTPAMKQVIAIIWLPSTLVLLSVLVNYYSVFHGAVLVLVGAIHVAIAAAVACFSLKQQLCNRFFLLTRIRA